MRFKNCMICCLAVVGSINANMMRDMAVMMGGQMGGSIANQSVSAEFTGMQTALTKDQTAINDAMNNFSIQVQAAQKKDLTNVFNLFSKVQENISNLLATQQSGMVAMDAYLQSVLDRQQPQQEFLMNPTMYDQYFTNGTMYTPEGPVWKNPFPVGNWEYDETSDSFWQMSNVSLLDANNLPDKALNNSIFSEFFQRAAEYEIECEITLYNLSYPFFAGIIFNKARWISGDVSRLQKYRLFGLYGDANQKVSLCFAEATPLALASATTAATWSYPFAKVMTGSATLKTKIDQTLFQDLKLSAIAFHLKIKNSPTKIQYKIWPTSSIEPTNFTTVKSNNPDAYLYHGIGFMAPGTLSEFKLLQPTELLFSSAKLIRFKGEVQALVQKNLTSQFASTVDAGIVAGAKS